MFDLFIRPLFEKESLSAGAAAAGRGPEPSIKKVGWSIRFPRPHRVDEDEDEDDVIPYRRTNCRCQRPKPAVVSKPNIAVTWFFALLRTLSTSTVSDENHDEYHDENEDEDEDEVILCRRANCRSLFPKPVVVKPNIATWFFALLRRESTETHSDGLASDEIIEWAVIGFIDILEL